MWHNTAILAWIIRGRKTYLRKPPLFEVPMTKCSIAYWEEYSIKALDTSISSSTTSLQCIYGPTKIKIKINWWKAQMMSELWTPKWKSLLLFLLYYFFFPFWTPNSVHLKKVLWCNLEIFMNQNIIERTVKFCRGKMEQEKGLKIKLTSFRAQNTRYGRKISLVCSSGSWQTSALGSACAILFAPAPAINEVTKISGN